MLLKFSKRRKPIIAATTSNISDPVALQEIISSKNWEMETKMVIKEKKRKKKKR